MTVQKTRRRSINIKGFQHSNPVPAGCVLGNLLVTGLIPGRDPQTGTYPDTLEEQAALMYQNMREILAAAGCTLDDVLKVTLWMEDRNKRAPVNVEWLKMFPNPDTRPARAAFTRPSEPGRLIECEVMAVLPDGSQAK
jgi:2-iminobutanoate/2-iminopropanoate deaminase